jgi:hypothetical protein
MLHHKRALAQRIVAGDDGVSRVPVGAMIRAAIAAKAIRSRTPEKLSPWDIILRQDDGEVACHRRDPPPRPVIEHTAKPAR